MNPLDRLPLLFLGPARPRYFGSSVERADVLAPPMPNRWLDLALAPRAMLSLSHRTWQHYAEHPRDEPMPDHNQGWLKWFFGMHALRLRSLQDETPENHRSVAMDERSHR